MPAHDILETAAGLAEMEFGQLEKMPVRTCEFHVTPGRTEHSTAEEPRKGKS